MKIRALVTRVLIGEFTQTDGPGKGTAMKYAKLDGVELEKAPPPRQGEQVSGFSGTFQGMKVEAQVGMRLFSTLEQRAEPVVCDLQVSSNDKGLRVTDVTNIVGMSAFQFDHFEAERRQNAPSAAGASAGSRPAPPLTPAAPARSPQAVGA